jgi:hypothetical protein
MRVLVCLAALLWAASAEAAVGPSPPQDPGLLEPQSIWTRSADGTIEHQQSGLRCPRLLGPLPRHGTRIYDGYGLDVSCGYSAADVVITVYLTRGVALEPGLAEARAQLEQRVPAKLLSEGRASLGGLDWRKVEYQLDDDMRSDIWMADLHGWAVKYRATYPADRAELAAQLLATLTNAVQASAGKRLALCAKTGSPSRAGVRVTDQKELGDFSIRGGLLGAIALAAEKDKQAKPAAPPTFCVEAPVENTRFLFWRGVGLDGGDAQVDRLTGMTMGSPPVLEVARDGLGDLVSAESSGKAGPPHWTAALTQNDRTMIFGYFAGRPSADQLAPLMEEIVTGKATPITAYSAEGRNVNVTVTPPR